MTASTPLDATTRTLAFQNFSADNETVTFVEHLTFVADDDSDQVRGITMLEISAAQWRKLGAPSAITAVFTAIDDEAAAVPTDD